MRATRRRQPPVGDRTPHRKVTTAMPNPPLPRLFAIDELAIQLGTSVRHLRRPVAGRRIPFVKLGGKLRFDSAEIARWVDQGRVKDRSARR